MVTPGGVVLLLLALWLGWYKGRLVMAGILLGVFLGTTHTGSQMIGTVNDVCAQVATAASDLYDSVVKQ